MPCSIIVFRPGQTALPSSYSMLALPTSQATGGAHTVTAGGGGGGSDKGLAYNGPPIDPPKRDGLLDGQPTPSMVTQCRPPTRRVTPNTQCRPPRAV